MEGITHADCKDFQIQNLSEYHDLYVQSDNLYLQIYLKASSASP